MSEIEKLIESAATANELGIVTEENEDEIIRRFAWIGPGQNWLIDKANAHFHAWAESKDGAKWRADRNKSPYHCGYSQPQWMKDARKALGDGDEESFKRIKLDNL